VDHSIEDYNQSLLFEHNELKCHCKDLQTALVEAHSDTKKRVANLEAKVKSAQAHDEKHLRDFKDGLIRKLLELCGLYVGNVQTIGGLCLQLSTEEPSVEDCLRRLSEEITGLPDMFSGVNENFATTAIEEALAMAGDSVDLDIVRGTTVKSGADVLPIGHNEQRAARAVSKKWWHSFGYDYVLVAIRANHEKVLFYLRF
jgi:hypothetical protein